MAIVVQTVRTYALDGSTKDFIVPFEYLARKFVQVSLLGTAGRKQLVLNSEFRFSTKNQVTLLQAWGPANGYDRVELRRHTSSTERLVDFTDGSILRATDLNISQIQAIHIAEEARDAALLALPQDDDGNLDAKNRRIVNLAPGINAKDAINKKQLDETLGEAGGVLSDIKTTQGEIYDYIEKFADDSALVRGVAWVYNNGSANGGERVIRINKPTKVFAVPYIEVNGSRQEVGYHFEFDGVTQSLTLAKPLESGDFLMAMTTESHIPLEDMLASPIGASSIGTTSGGTVQDHLLKVDILPSSSGASNVGVSQGGTVQDVLTRVSVLTFGAVGDGVTDDTEAFNRAWKSSRSHILIPEGYTFVITDRVGSLTEPKAKKWCGEPGAKVLLKGEGKFSVTGIGWGFDSIHFIPYGVVPVAIQSGLVQNNRFSHITNCDFRGVTSGSYFGVCIDLYNVWYSKFSNININGSGEEDFSKQTIGGTGIRMSYCVNNNITDCQIGSCVVGIELADAKRPNTSTPHCCEGIFISESTLIANQTSLKVSDGYFIKVSSNVIDIPLTSTVNPVIFRGMSSQLTDNWISIAHGTIYVGKGTSGLGSYDGTGNIISRNTIRGSSGSDNVAIQVGPIGILTIADNNITFGGYGIKSDGGANWLVTGNTFAAQKTMAYDLHLTKLVRIGVNKVYSGGTPSKSVTEDSVLTPTTYSATVDVSLVESPMGENKVTGPQPFTVNIPSGHFLSAPEVAIANLATGRVMGVARYIKGESTATSLKFSFVSIGSPVTGGKYAFSVIASDKNSSF